MKKQLKRKANSSIVRNGHPTGVVRFYTYKLRRVSERLLFFRNFRNRDRFQVPAALHWTIPLTGEPSATLHPAIPHIGDVAVTLHSTLSLIEKSPAALDSAFPLTWETTAPLDSAFLQTEEGAAALDSAFLQMDEAAVVLHLAIPFIPETSRRLFPQSGTPRQKKPAGSELNRPATAHINQHSDIKSGSCSVF